MSLRFGSNYRTAWWRWLGSSFPLYFVFSYALLRLCRLEQCTALPVGAKAIGRIPAIGRTPVGATAHPDMMGGIGATAQLEQAPAQLEKAKHGSPAQLENQMKDPGGTEDVC
jgi:hypothetical protein